MCPWTVRFASEVPGASPFAPRDVLRGRAARTLARDLLGMTQPEFYAAFKSSPMQRAKLEGLQARCGRGARQSLAALGTGCTRGRVDVLARALDDEEPLVREHAALALARVRARRQTK